MNSASLLAEAGHSLSDLLGVSELDINTSIDCCSGPRVSSPILGLDWAFRSGERDSEGQEFGGGFTYQQHC